MFSYLQLFLDAKIIFVRLFHPESYLAQDIDKPCKDTLKYCCFDDCIVNDDDNDSSLDNYGTFSSACSPVIVGL